MIWPFQIWRFQNNVVFDSYFRKNEALKNEILNAFKSMDDHSDTAKAMFEDYIFSIGF
jgi:hypothetical protein